MSLQETSGLRLIRGDGRPCLGLTRPQRQAIFRAMVAGELRRGGMSRRRWRRLVQYGALLDLSAVEAGELIMQAREAVNRPEPFACGLTPAERPPTENAAWPLWAKVSVGCALFAVADAVWLHWVL